MKKIFETPVIEIISINNEDVLTTISGLTYFENELPISTFNDKSEF